MNKLKAIFFALILPFKVIALSLIILILESLTFLIVKLPDHLTWEFLVIKDLWKK